MIQSADPFSATLQEWIGIFMRHSIRNFIHYSRECGLSMSQIGALFYLHRKGTSGVTDLGDSLGVTSAAASQMLERLVQQGLIQRSEDPYDRRVKQIVLTDKGRQTLKESFHTRQGWLDNLVASLSEKEKNQIMAALRIMIDKANQLKHNTEREP